MSNIQISINENDHRYYPIDYPAAVLSTVLTINTKAGKNWCPWVVSIDKSKFFCGVSASYDGSNYKLNVFTVGF